MSKDEIEDFARSMSEEEMRARAEAAAMGQWKIIEVAIGALIMTSAHPDVVKSAIMGTLGDLERAAPEHPSLSWSPPAIHAGAKAAATRILGLYDSAQARAATRNPN